MSAAILNTYSRLMAISKEDARLQSSKVTEQVWKRCSIAENRFRRKGEAIKAWTLEYLVVHSGRQSMQSSRGIR